MRITTLPLMLLSVSGLSACDLPAALFPGVEIGQAVSDPGYTQRRGAVELYVMTNHQAILTDIAMRGGAHLTQAFDLAQVPVTHRPGRTAQLEADRGLYEANPASLVSTLMVYGGSAG